MTTKEDTERVDIPPPPDLCTYVAMGGEAFDKTGDVPTMPPNCVVVVRSGQEN